jgi:hypothetical protein
MSISNTNLDIKRGDSKTYTIKFRDKDNNPVDITGWKVYFTVKTNLAETDENAKIKKDVVSHVDPINGETQINLTATDTNLVGNYIFDIQYKNLVGEVKTIVEGFINFAKDITRRTS